VNVISNNVEVKIEMGIIAKMKSVGKAIKSAWHHRKLLGLATTFLIGLVLICSAAFVLKGTPLIIALTIGGILIIISWGTMTFNAAVKRSIRLQEAEKLEEENRQLLERESILKQQLEEARNRKLQVLDVQPILKLQVLEADCQISRCFDFFIDKNGQIITEESSKEPSGILSVIADGLLGERKWRFVGTLTINFKARYGTSFQDVRIQRDDHSKTVYVEGADITYQGTGDFPRTSWAGCVVLREQWDGDWIADDEALKLESPCKDICRDDMEKSLQNGPEQLEWLKQPLQNTVKHLLQMMIAPPGYSLVFVDKIEGDSMPFFEYAAHLGLDKPRLGGGEN